MELTLSWRTCDRHTVKQGTTWLQLWERDFERKVQIVKRGSDDKCIKLAFKQLRERSPLLGQEWTRGTWGQWGDRQAGARSWVEDCVRTRNFQWLWEAIEGRVGGWQAEDHWVCFKESTLVAVQSSLDKRQSWREGQVGSECSTQVVCGSSYWGHGVKKRKVDVLRMKWEAELT